MDNSSKVLIGKYYIRLKNVHINWTHKTGPKREKEAYIPIPAQYAYSYGILKSYVYTCTYSDSGETVQLKAAGSQSRHSYAKQFQGFDNLQILYDWYAKHNAIEGDWVVVSIFSGNCISIEYVSQCNAERIAALNLVGNNGRPAEAESPLAGNQRGLRLISLLVENSSSTICNYQFVSSKSAFNADEPFTTLIIGANSTGKSFVMKVLSEVIQAVSNNSLRKSLSYDYYSLKYYLDEDSIEIEIKNRIIIIHKNNVLVEKTDDAVLPQKVLAIAFMLNDKFPFKAESQDKAGIYEYLGMRKSSNAAWTSTFNSRVAENLLELACTEKLWPMIRALSSYLGIEPRMSLSYELSQSPFSLEQIREMSVDKLEKGLREHAAGIAEKGYYRKNAVSKLEIKDFREMAEYLKGLEDCDPFVPNNDCLIFGHTFSEETQQDHMQEILSDYRVLKELQSLQIIRDTTLFIHKHGQKYSFEECSSGEKHILYAFLNIARYVRENSLILIDEPEISLHPNWQIQYITVLKQLFREYASCHFVIASHSPYLVSDLNPESSALIVLSMENNIRTASTLNYSTYAWSTENILYNVFHVRTTRNYYFDIELRELLSYTSGINPPDLQRTRELYNKLSSYVFDSKDPLNLILGEVKEHIENVEPDKSAGING